MLILVFMLVFVLSLLSCDEDELEELELVDVYWIYLHFGDIPISINVNYVAAQCDFVKLSAIDHHSLHVGPGGIADSANSPRRFEPLAGCRS